jgi:exodeoxyribonuclease VII small subunit
MSEKKQPDKDKDGNKEAPPDTSFEEDLLNLKNLVNSLESQTLDLDEAIRTFEKGVSLSRKLTEKLASAEKRLERIAKGEDGRPRTEPLTTLEALHSGNGPFAGGPARGASGGSGAPKADAVPGKDFFPDIEEDEEEDEFDPANEERGFPQDFFEGRLPEGPEDEADDPEDGDDEEDEDEEDDDDEYDEDEDDDEEDEDDMEDDDED